MSGPPNTETAVEKRFPYVPAQFKPGNPGRQVGSRNKLGEDFIAALANDFSKNGVKAIEKVRTDRPDVYLKVIAQIVPKELTIKTDVFDGFTDEQLTAILLAARAALGPLASGRDDLGEAPQ